MQLFLIEISGYSFTFIEGVVGIVAFIGGLAGLFKAVKDVYEMGIGPAFKKFKDWIRFRRTLSAKMDAVLAQVTTNGGSSLKDIVLDTASSVQKMKARMDHQDERSPQPMFHLKATGEMCYANCAFRELLDAEERDLLHRDYLSRVHSSDRAILDHEITDAIAKKMPFDVTVKFRRRTDVVAVRLEASPNVVSGGELYGFFGTASQVSA